MEHTDMVLTDMERARLETLAAEDNLEAVRALAAHWHVLAERAAFADEELNARLYDCQQLAATLDPYGETMAYGELCARGIGCRPSFRLARKCFEEAYAFGHREAALRLSDLWLECSCDDSLPADEQEMCLNEAVWWLRLNEERRIKN